MNQPAHHEMRRVASVTSAPMITIQIPEWLQWAAVGLAVAYAIPRALRAVVVAIYWLSKLLLGRWPIRDRRISGQAALMPVPVIGGRRQIWSDLRFWALGTSVFEAEHWPRYRERSDSSDQRSDAGSAMGS